MRAGTRPACVPVPDKATVGLAPPFEFTVNVAG